MSTSTLEGLKARLAARRDEARAERREEARAATLTIAAGVDRDRASELEAAMIEIRGLQSEIAEAEGLLRQAQGQDDSDLASDIESFMRNRKERLETVLSSVGNAPLVSVIAEMDGIAEPSRKDTLRFAQEGLGPRYIHEMPSGDGSVLFDERKKLSKSGENLPPNLRSPIWKVDGTRTENHNHYFQLRWFSRSEQGFDQLIAEARVYCRAYGDLHYRFRKVREAYGAKVAQIRRAEGTIHDILEGVQGVVVPGRFTEERPWEFPRLGDKPGERSGRARGDFALNGTGQPGRFVVVFPAERAFIRISTDKLGITEEGLEKVIEIKDATFAGARAVNGTDFRNPGLVRRFFCLGLGLPEPEQTSTTPTAIATALANPRGKRESRSKKGRK